MLKDNLETNLDLYNYYLPHENIAQSPVVPRDFSKLMIYNTIEDKIIIDKFYNLHKYLNKNYFLVFNETKVLPAKVTLFKETGGKVKALFLLSEKIEDLQKNKLKEIRGMVDRGLKIGENIYFDLKDKNNYLKVIKQEKNIFTFKIKSKNFLKPLNRFGEAPLPPYIKNSPLSREKLKEKYQTIFAKKIGSIAAPTASFHFTPRVLRRLKNKKIKYYFVTLHVGLATFTPLKEEYIKTKKLPPEYWEIDIEVYEKIKKLKQEGKKMIAVGTTTTRMLESLVRFKKKRKNNKIYGTTKLFIMPPFKFKMVDALITNFHLPRSSLMMLVEAFLNFKNSKKHLKELYQIAIDKNFRFYSFGDAMLII